MRALLLLGLSGCCLIPDVAPDLDEPEGPREQLVFGATRLTLWLGGAFHAPGVGGGMGPPDDVASIRVHFFAEESVSEELLLRPAAEHSATLRSGACSSGGRTWQMPHAPCLRSRASSAPRAGPVATIDRGPPPWKGLSTSREGDPMSEFTVRPFAFMRLTHEALRERFATLQRAAHARDLETAASTWSELQALIRLHKEHEEAAFFPLLDERFDGAVAEAGLREVHAREAAMEEAVGQAIGGWDADALVEAVDGWADDFEAHLSKEEAVMMPLTQRVADTVEGRAEAVRGILDVDWAALQQVHLPFVTRSLARSKPYGPVRMFVAAVQAAAGDRYGELEPTIRRELPAHTAAALVGHGHLSA